MSSAQLASRLRRVAPSTWIAAAVFVGALLSRTAWLREVYFHPDGSTVLWMALDAVRDASVPDHGLVSSFHVFQPPGLVWAAMPWVALGGGRPEVAIVGFALLNAAAIALLVATVGRLWGLLYAAVLGVFLVVGPDAFFSAWLWHPSLYTAAVALLLAAGLRLRNGSAWWASVLVAIPGLYALAHYSGVVLAAPAVLLLLLARRPWRSLLYPVAVGALIVGWAWVPFLTFQIERGWLDLDTVANGTNTSGSLGSTLEARLDGLRYAATHLGQAPFNPVHLSRVVLVLVVASVALALVRRRWRDPGFAIPALVLASGVGAQVLLAQGERLDALLLWLVPAYALAAWAVVQVAELVQRAVAGRAVAPLVAGAAIAVLGTVGIVDLADSVDDVPLDRRLSAAWEAARADEPVRFNPLGDEGSEHWNYLPCDPPYDWGSEIWYLREVLEEGRGLQEASDAGAFERREGTPCERA